MNEPTDLQDARWRSLVEANATGEDLSATDREFLRRYQSQSDEVRAEQALLSALGRMGDDDDDRDDATLVDDVVRRYVGEASPKVASLPTAASRRAWWPWAVATVAAASLATVWLWPDATTPPADTIAQTTADRTEGPTPTPPTRSESSEPAEPPATSIMLASGQLADADARPVELEPVTATGVVTATGPDTCVRFGAATACFDEGTRLQLHQRGDRAWAEVIEGRARIESAAPSDDAAAPVATTFEIRVAGTSYTSMEPAVWTVEVHEAKATVDVTEGKVRIEPEEGTPTTLTAAETSRTADARPARVPDADTLLERARRQRAEGNRKAAISDYEALVRQHPKAPAAGPSLVTLGELHLEAGHAKTALRWFERYVDRGGPLEEEAMYGQIRALRALGRDEAEAEARRRFLERFPASSYASKLRRSP